MEAGRVTVTLGVENSQFERGLQSSRRQVEAFTNQTGMATRGLDKMGGALANYATGLISMGAIAGGLRTSFRAFDELEASTRRLAATAKITHQNLGFLQKTALDVRQSFGLSAAGANSFTIELSKLTAKAGQVEKTSAAVRAFLDLGAAQGLSAEATLRAVQQAMLGIDEGTDKLFGKNPSVLYDEFAKSLGTTAGKLSDNGKAAAILAAAMRDGGEVAGEYGRWLDSAAGEQERLKIKSAEAAATIGGAMNGVRMAVLPVLADLATKLVHFTGGIQLMGAQLPVFFGQVRLAIAEADDATAGAIGKTAGAVQKISDTQRNALRKLPGGEAIARALGYADISRHLADAVGGATKDGVDQARAELERLKAAYQDAAAEIVRNIEGATTITGSVDPLSALVDLLTSGAGKREKAKSALDALQDRVSTLTGLYDLWGEGAGEVDGLNEQIAATTRTVLATLEKMGPALTPARLELERMRDALLRTDAGFESAFRVKLPEIKLANSGLAMGAARSLLPTPEQIEQQFAAATGRLNELAARGLIDRKALEEGGKQAAKDFNAALLRYLEQTKLDPKIRAEIQAKLKLDLGGDASGWKEAASAAATAAQGAINVGDALGKLGDQSRRALTGVAQLAQSVGQLKGGPLMQLGNLPGLAGILGSAAQIGAAIFGKQDNPEEQARHRELVGALGDLAVKLGGFRATANAIRGTAEVAKALQGFKDPRAAGQMFFRMLETHGLTLQEVVAVAKEFGVSLLNDKGQLDANKLASKEFAEILAQASKTLVGFRNTLDDQKKRQSLSADLFNLPNDAAAGLAAQMEILAKFMPEFAKGLGEIDTATAEGRARLEAEIQRMFSAFDAGTLSLEDLTREEFLSLIEGFAGAFDAFREATNKASGALLNVPAVFDLALRRRQAALAGAGPITVPAPPSGGVPYTPGAGSTSGGGRTRPEPTLQVNINNPPAGMDVPATVRQVADGLTKILRAPGTSEFKLAVRQA